MNEKTKRLSKVLVVALALLLIVALALGLSGAWYNATRKATGTIELNQGIIINYSGFEQGSGTWEEETDTISFKLFSTDGNLLPGATVNMNSASIKADTSSVDFYARLKLEYKFFSDAEGNTEVTNSVSNYSAFLSTPAFDSAWVTSNDGYYYYATGTTLNAVPNASYVDVFASGANIVLNGDAEGFNHEGRGYVYSNDVTIRRIEAYLTLEALQANPAAATYAHWAVTVPAQYTDNAGVVYTQNANNTWTLTDGTALNSDSSSTSASTLSARIYDNDSYSYTILSTIDGQDVTAIGDEAFLNASQLTAVTIPTTVSTIGVRAFEGTGLNAITLTENVTSVGTNALNTNSLSEVTIENEDSVITGIAAAGIPTASTINVPSATLSGYETTLGASYTNLAAAAPAASVGLAYEYDSEHQTYTVTGIGTFSGTDLVIPSTYDDGVNGGHSVTSIGLDAFWGCTGLTSVTIPSSVTSIGGRAFSDCTGLTSFSGGNSKYQIIDNGRCLVEVDGNQQTLIAFAPSGLTSYIIPSSVTGIGVNVFYNCTGLTSVTIPSSVTSIEDCAFQSCTSLTSVTIPSSATSIGLQAFDGCTGLTSVTIPSSVTYIGRYAFRDCTGLTSITIPNSVTSIEWDTFQGCTGLTSVTIPSSVTYIWEGAFQGCTGLTSITIPSSVTSISEFAFSACTCLTSVTFEGSGRTAGLTIGDYAFSDCSDLATVNWNNWPSGVTATVGNNAFANCAPGLVVNIPNQE